MIRVRLALKYDDKHMAELLYKACLQEAVSEAKLGLDAEVRENMLLMHFKNSSASKTAERLSHILSVMQMAEHVARLLEA